MSALLAASTIMALSTKNGIAGCTGPNGLIGVNGIFSNISRNNLVSLRFISLNGHVGFISIIGLIGLLISHLITLGIAGVAVIIWLVRLEGRVNGKATTDQVAAVSAQIGTTAAVVSNLQAKDAAHDNTRDEVIRLQEQIKHLTDLIERLLPLPPSTRRKPIA
jgi:hypothetical protein